MSTTFSVTRDDIINRALRICGAYDATNPPSSTDFSVVSLAMNMMIKAWIVDGVSMWKVETVNIPLLSGQNTYNVGPYATGTGAVVRSKILKILNASVRDNTSASFPFDTVIDLISIQEYENFGSKNSQGVVNSMVYRPLDDSTSPAVSSFIQVYPTPADNFHALRLVVYTTINDVNVGTDPLDFPQETYLALSWNLAKEICMEYSVPMERVGFITKMAKEAFDTMKDWSQENAETIRFMFDKRGGE